MVLMALAGRPQLLFQESNPGVRYEYTIHREADGPGPVEPPEFSWSYGPWTQCTVTCGTGEDGSAGVSGQGPASASSSVLTGKRPRTGAPAPGPPQPRVGSGAAESRVLRACRDGARPAPC